MASALLLDDKDAWGAMGQWAGAFGTVVAVSVALRISQREADNEAERRQAEKADRALEQARLVIGVIEYPTAEEESYSNNMFGASPPEAVRITNFSAQPVYHPRVEGFVHQNGGDVTWDSEGEPPLGGYDAAPTVLATSQHDVIPLSLAFNPPVTPDMYPMRTKVIIGYTDAEGHRWRRTGEGTPELVRAGDSFEAGGPDWYRAER
ncbi:hypothetical protein ABT256_21865 [Amycolatopsis japonica]|uniref:hypothetical protein n=1 Tax=Amycolatopsis japonica TaxID=208439 RepID=UPI00331DC72B